MVITLSALMVGLIVLVVLIARAAVGAQAPVRHAMLRLAWFAVALLGVTAVLLVWVLIRYVRERFQAPSRRGRTDYVDAWREAGRRFRLDSDEQEEDDASEGDASPS
jgi:membrane protein implicated in regulation of membrane protease activity